MNGTIVFKKRELLIPEDYLGKVLAARPNGLSYALHRSSDKKPNIVLERGEGKFEVKDIMDIQNDAVEEEVLFWFMEASKFHSEDMMPFTILGDEKADEGPRIIGFATGKFPNFIPQASDHTNEYFLFNKYLVPKLTAMGKDHDAIFNNLGNDLTKIELNAMGGHIVFLACNGRLMPFGEGRSEFEWGWVTDAHGHAETKIAEPVIQQAKRVVGQMLRRKGDDRSTSTERPIASVTPIQQPKPDTAIPQEERKEYTFQPEPGTSRGEMKKQYKRITGSLPHNWKDRPAVRYTKAVTITTVAEHAADQPKIIKDFKEIDKSKYGTPVEEADREAAVTTTDLPVLGPKVLQAISDDYKLDKQSGVIRDPETISKDMEKFPSFWEEVPNIPQNITDAWSWDDFVSFGTKYTMAMCKLAWSYRNELVTGEEYAEAMAAERMDTSGTGVVAPDKEKPVEATAPASSGAPRSKMQMLKRKTG